MFPEHDLAIVSLKQLRGGVGGEGGVNAAIVVMHLLLNELPPESIESTKEELGTLVQQFADQQHSMEQFHVLSSINDLSQAIAAYLQGRVVLAALLADRVRGFVSRGRLTAILPISVRQLALLPTQTEEQRQADFERERKKLDEMAADLVSEPRHPLMDLFSYFI